MQGAQYFILEVLNIPTVIPLFLVKYVLKITFGASGINIPTYGIAIWHKCNGFAGIDQRVLD